MKEKVLTILMLIIVFLSLPTVVGFAQAASFGFDQTTVTVGVNETFVVTVTEDLGTEQTNSSQAYILYDSTLLQAQSVAAGSFFPTVSNSITTAGKVFLVGYVDGTSVYKTGTGNFATITFKALKNGTGTLTIDCRTGVSDSSQIIKYNDANATNLLICAQNTSVAVTVGTGTAEPLPTALPQSGVVEDSIKLMTLIGFALVIIGGGLRLAL